MEYGTGLSVEWLADLGAVRDAAGALDAAGFDYVSLGGRVLSSPEGRFERPAATYAGAYRDPFVLFANLAATTSTIHFRTSILILPLFPTVLVAKQSAELSLISGGRFELGVGLSWNEPEYVAFGQDIHTRGRRVAEQMIVLKRLWSEEFVTFSGEFHEIDNLGIGHRPTEPIPIWVGTGQPTSAILRRIGTLADGWMPMFAIASSETVDELDRYAAEADRKGAVGIVGRIAVHPEDVALSVPEAEAQIALGVTALQIGAPAGSSISDGIASVIATREALVEAFG